MPYSALHGLVSLSALEDGTVALVALDPLSYAAWRMDAWPIATFLGVKIGTGTVLLDVDFTSSVCTDSIGGQSGENKAPQTEALHVRRFVRVRLGSLDAAGTRI